MRRNRWALALIACALLATLLPTRPVAARDLEQSTGLSPYWGAAILQWEDLIIEHATARGLDPDLVAAVIWKESLGRAYYRGPAGAVGLMMVMPKEAGFSWRPTIEELENPAVNLYWGARTLSIIIAQAHGDLYKALAAYNGGWDQVHLRGPTRYATQVLDEYSRAVAMRHGLSPEGHWVATIAATDEHDRTVLTVLGPRSPLARYTLRPVAAPITDATCEGLPTAVIFAPYEGQPSDSRVGLWLLLDGRVIRDEAGSAPTEQPLSAPLSAVPSPRVVWTQPETAPRAF